MKSPSSSVVTSPCTAMLCARSAARSACAAAAVRSLIASVNVIAPPLPIVPATVTTARARGRPRRGPVSAVNVSRGLRGAVRGLRGDLERDEIEAGGRVATVGASPGAPRA